MMENEDDHQDNNYEVHIQEENVDQDRVDDVHIESIEEVSVVQESVSEEEMEEHDEQVENFAEDEPAKIYVVPRKERQDITIKSIDIDCLSSNLLVGNILSEKCNQSLLLLLLIFDKPGEKTLTLRLMKLMASRAPLHLVVVSLKHFMKTFFYHFSAPCSCALAKELHEPTLHAQPAEARAVEQEGIEYQVEGNPLEIRLE